MRRTLGARAGLRSPITGALDTVDVVLAWMFAVVSIAVMLAVF